MIADRRRGRLHEEDFLAAYGFEKLHHYVAVWIPVHDTSTDLTAQLGRNQSCQRRVGRACEIANSLFTLASGRVVSQPDGSQPVTCVEPGARTVDAIRSVALTGINFSRCQFCQKGLS